MGVGKDKEFVTKPRLHNMRLALFPLCVYLG